MVPTATRTGKFRSPGSSGSSWSPRNPGCRGRGHEPGRQNPEAGAPGSGRARVFPGQRRGGGDPRAACGALPSGGGGRWGEARLPSALTMDSSRAGLCPGRPPSLLGPWDAAGCASPRLATGDGVCEAGTMRTRLGSLAPPRRMSGAPRTGRLTDGDERPMEESVGAGRRLDPASTPTGRGRAGGEREAGQKRPPTGSGCVSGLWRKGLGLRPQTLLRVGGVVLSSAPALRPRLGPGLRPRTSLLEAGLSLPSDLGRGLNLCSQTLEKASRGLGLTSAPRIPSTSQDTNPGMQNRHTDTQ
ncbi:putative uncharacterized protein C19orf73 homolog [Hylobates moloch]|uniref:putative uncharacterized protein C19orf73 homolog n=1 Tax=Hylobates moloch TaxID=81572 RepID=UPI0013638B98|nr:putative uncharacterized protein C19orf73 homolog [Hylobates moloch]